MTPDLYEACKQAVHIITPTGEVIKAGRAGLFILEKVGYPRWLVGLLRLPPAVWFVEWGYKRIANNRNLFAKFLFTSEDGSTIIGLPPQK